METIQDEHKRKLGEASLPSIDAYFIRMIRTIDAHDDLKAWYGSKNENTWKRFVHGLEMREKLSRLMGCHP